MTCSRLRLGSLRISASAVLATKRPAASMIQSVSDFAECIHIRCSWLHPSEPSEALYSELVLDLVFTRIRQITDSKATCNRSGKQKEKYSQSFLQGLAGNTFAATLVGSLVMSIYSVLEERPLAEEDGDDCDAALELALDRIFDAYS